MCNAKKIAFFVNHRLVVRPVRLGIIKQKIVNVSYV